MIAETLVNALEQEGIRLRVEGKRLKLEAPVNKVPSPETIARLRENKAAVVEYIRGRSLSHGIQFFSFSEPSRRKTEKLESLSPSTQLHIKLFPFIGRKVRTPGGLGTLLQVFADRATVVLDSKLCQCSFFAPGEIAPVSREL
jgi:hypothetical protein